MKYHIEFRNFSDTYVVLSHYLNGNVCLELFSGYVKLCELTINLSIVVSQDRLILKNLAYAPEIIEELMKNKIIKDYYYFNSLPDISHVCILSDGIDIPEYCVSMSRKVAMLG